MARDRGALAERESERERRRVQGHVCSPDAKLLEDSHAEAGIGERTFRNCKTLDSSKERLALP